MTRTNRVLNLLFILAVPLFLITASVTWAVNDAGLYNRGFEKYQISRYTGITNHDLRQAGADIRHYFNSGEEPLALRARVQGVEREIFNQREVAHMHDVKGLIRGVYWFTALSAVYILGFVAAGYWRYRNSFTQRLARLFLWGSGVTVGLVVAVGLFALVGFNSLFLIFHQISFSNNLWQLDPRTDYLIIMFPLGFWFDATIRVALSSVGGALILATLSGGYLVYRRWMAKLAEGRSPAQLEGTSRIQ
ncbi:MAG: TIGR01906 family membrane protein [Dehalococcoidia bacterium]